MALIPAFAPGLIEAGRSCPLPTVPPSVRAVRPAPPRRSSAPPGRPERCPLLLTVPRAPWPPAGMLRLVATAGLLLCSVAVYSGGHVAALTLPARHQVTDADMERLAQSVAEHLTGADFDEPAGNRLRLSVRGDLLFVKGVGRSCRRQRCPRYRYRDSPITSQPVLYCARDLASLIPSVCHAVIGGVAVDMIQYVPGPPLENQVRHVTHLVNPDLGDLDRR